MSNVYIKTAEGGETTTPTTSHSIPLDDGTNSTHISLTNLLKFINSLTEVTPDESADWVGGYDNSGAVAAKFKIRRLLVYKKTGVVASPNNYYTTVRAQIPIFRADAAITITRIHIHGADTTPTTELAGDLKFADDLNTGGFANATVIDVCDTTSGVFTATSSFDDATVPSGKYVYFQMDAAPHTDWKDFYIEVYYTYD